MDYFFSLLLAFLVGILSGFQFIAGKYTKSPFRAARTFFGLAYLTIRGAIASIAFVILYATSGIRNWLPMWALITGASAEILLRTKIFVLEKQSPSGVSEEVMLGPLNLLVFFQGFFLDAIKERLSIIITGDRMNMLRKYLPQELTFEQFYDRVDRNLGALEDQSQEERTRSDLESLKQEYGEVRRAASQDTDVDGIYKEKLGYKLLQLGNQKFKLLVDEPPHTG